MYNNVANTFNNIKIMDYNNANLYNKIANVYNNIASMFKNTATLVQQYRKPSQQYRNHVNNIEHVNCTTIFFVTSEKIAKI